MSAVSSARRTRATTATVVLSAVFSLLLTGCADTAERAAGFEATASGTASASNGDATDATSGSTAEPSAQSSAESSAEPESDAPALPELVKDRAFEGAMAAVHHWFAGVHHAQLTGDVSAIDEVSWGTCVRCEEEMTAWVDQAAQGCFVEFDGEPELRIYRAEVFEGWKFARVNLAYSEPDGTQRGGGCAGDFEAFDDSLVIHLAYAGIDGRWKMEDFWTWDEYETWLEQNAQESG